MSKLKVIRASAGSGKTYRITADYLRLIFRYPKNYKHILAVTFTNKATGEMKTRIIRELYMLSLGENSPYTVSLIKEFNLSQNEIREKSKLILDNILHNYSRFTISTIDSFFQRIIKSFAREAGLQHNFEVELDIDDVLEKAIEQMLLKLENDNTLLGWLVQFAEQRIEEGKNWDFKKELMRLGKELFNEKFKTLTQSFHQRLTDRNWLKEFQSQLFAICNNFESKLKVASIEGMNIMSAHGLKPADFKFGIQGGVGQYFLRLSHGEVVEPSKRITDAAESLDNWLPNGKVEAALVQSAADAGLFNLFRRMINYFQENYKIYKSSNEILASFFTLGILADLSGEINEYATRNNIFLLANSGVFLKTIIGENDAPFVYEKTGQNIYHFMIDEFQDTSAIQWHNFLPLINNSLSENHDCMVVGDVKQSIYRWRNSDWKIMASQLDKDISEHGIRFDNLAINWRSKANVVAFNNTFFSLASKILQQALNQSLPDTLPENEIGFFKQIISNAYEGCMQKLPSGRKKDEGFVKIQFINDENKDWKDKVLTGLPSVIENLQIQGHRLKDIAILVRTASEGAEVAEFLNAYNENVASDHPYKYQVLSNESTFLKNAPVVVFLIKLFKYLVTSEDAINTTSLAYDYDFFFKQHENNQSPKPKAQSPKPIANSSLNFLPAEFTDKIEQLKHLPPDELFEHLIILFRLNERISDLPFLQALHDCIIEFIRNNPPSLLAFLEYWEEKQDTLSVSVSEDQDAIRVMTIHKSKGLEFADVIVPFCNWNLDHSWPNTPFIWCSTNVSPFNQLEFHPLRYSSGLQDTVFAYNYFLEKAQVFVDNLNLLYVAFTRASDNIFAFMPFPEKEEKLSTIGELVYKWIKTGESILEQEFPIINISNCWKTEEKLFESGKPGYSHKTKIPETIELPLKAYPSNELKEKLRQRYSSPGFWDTTEDNRPPVRIYGNHMHRLFQDIQTAEDIEKAVDNMIFRGLIKEVERDALNAEVKSLLSEMPFKEWFSGSWKVMNEAGIVVPNQHLYRPDRVMMKGKETLVVDYKFGKIQDSRYNAQVKKYTDYLKAMGYSKVEGVIWYVNLNLIERV